MQFLGLAFLSLFLASPVAQDASPSVSFVLATSNGQTTFRIGEAINLEFRFSSGVLQKYQPVPCYPNRRFVVLAADTFNVEPMGGTVDPLRDSSYLYDPGPGSCITGVPVFIGESPTVRPRILNDWIQFTRPGHYRVQAATGEVGGLTLTSNAIEIDIVAAEPGWAATQARNAISTLREVSPASSQAEAAMRTLRYLGTPEAIPGLIEFLGQSSNELDAGLISSPFRNEVLSGLEDALVAPDVPITQSWLATLDRVAVAAAVGPRPVRDDSSYLAQFNVIAEKYRRMLTNAVAKKTGQARAVSLMTLVRAGMAMQSPPTEESTIRALTEVFNELPPGDQRNMLGAYWSSWASPSAHSLVLDLARGTGIVRNDALQRLLEFSTPEAREIVEDRVRKGDYTIVAGNFPEVLLYLPDETLPDLDETLATAYEQGRLPADRLIARYATERIYSRIRNTYVQRADHCGEILAYFFRVDPDSATTLRKDPQTGSACPLRFRFPIVRSAGMERVALEDLATSDPSVVDQALGILAEGSASVKDELLKRLEQIDSGSRMGASIVRAVLQPGDWTLTAEDFARLKTACGANSCRSDVQVAERSSLSPVAVASGVRSGATSQVNIVRIGPYAASDDEQIRKILQKFPPETKFRLQFVGRSWADQQRAEHIQNLFKTQGIELQLQ